MAPHVFWINTTIPLDDTGRRFLKLPFSTEEADTVLGLTEILQATGIVYGQKLFLADDGNGGRIVRRREPYGLGVSVIATVQNFLGTISEPE